MQLHDEFDFADAATAQLEVVFEVAALHFGLDHALHLAQALERTEVEVTAIDEGPQAVEETRALHQVTRHRAGLDPGVALPIAPFALEVVFHRGKRLHQPPDLPEGAQAHVHAPSHAIGGDLGKQLDELLAGALEPVAIVQRARAIALPGLGEGEHQVDVGRKIQLATAELAQREHHQALLMARVVARHAMALTHRRFHHRERGLQAVFRQPRGPGQSGIQRVDAVHVAMDQAHAFGVAILPQPRRPNGGFFGIKAQGWGRRIERIEQVGPRAKPVERVVAGDQQTPQSRHPFRLGINRGQGLRRHRAQALELARGKLRERRRQIH